MSQLLPVTWQHKHTTQPARFLYTSKYNAQHWVPREALVYMSNLLNEISKRRNLERAWHKIKRHADSSGVDDVTVGAFGKRLHTEIIRIGSLLRSRRYTFNKLRGHTVPKKSGPKRRPIRVSTVSDAVVMKAIELELNTQLGKHYKLDNGVSFGFLEGKQVKDAVERIRQLYAEGNGWVYVADIQDFFETVDTPSLLEDMVFPYLSDSSVNDLIERALTLDIGNREELRKRYQRQSNEVNIDKLFPPDVTGIPQGGTLSPLLANVYLNRLDLRMIKEGFAMVRYADDVTVMCKTEEEARRADRVVRKVLEKELLLTVHKTGEPGSSKSAIAPFEKFHEPILGISFRANKNAPEKTQIYPSLEVFQRHIKALQDFCRTPPHPDLLRNLQYLQAKTRGWAASYYFTDYSPKYYRPVDGSMLAAVRSIMARYGFYPKEELAEKDLAKMGISTYSQSFQSLKDKKKKKLTASTPS